MHSLLPMKKKYGESDEIECYYDPTETVIRTKGAKTIWFAAFLLSLYPLAVFLKSDSISERVLSLVLCGPVILLLLAFGDKSMITFSNANATVTIERTRFWGLWKVKTKTFNLNDSLFWVETHRRSKGQLYYSIRLQCGADEHDLIGSAIKEHMHLILKRLKSYVKVFNAGEDLSKSNRV